MVLRPSPWDKFNILLAAALSARSGLGSVERDRNQRFAQSRRLRNSPVARSCLESENRVLVSLRAQTPVPETDAEQCDLISPHSLASLEQLVGSPQVIPIPGLR